MDDGRQKELLMGLSIVKIFGSFTRFTKIMIEGVVPVECCLQCGGGLAQVGVWLLAPRHCPALANTSLFNGSVKTSK